MISEVVMPQMGADMTEGTLLRWLKNEGDDVARGEVIAEIETDKANVEIEAFDAGVFRLALAHEGDVVQVGEVIAVVADADDDISRFQNGAGPAVKPTASAPPTPTGAAAPPAQADAPAPTAPPRTHGGTTTPAQGGPSDRVRSSPLARRLAEERGLNLAAITGTGPGGRITKKDVEAASAGAAPSAPTAGTPRVGADVPGRGAPAATDARTVTPSKMRQAIARRMSQSKREAPHYYITATLDMTDALAFRRQLNETVEEEQRISVNDLIVRACAIALKRHPHFNATIEENEVREHPQQHICIGIALDEGLIAPAILDAGDRSLVEIGSAARDLIDRAKNGRLRAEEMSAGTFTISNLGAYGVETLIAIIQPPQTAILGVGTAAPRPVAVDGAVVIRDVMTIALSADHRVTDGAQGAQFLAETKRLLEKPLLLVV